jgi:hypothetical protein
MKKRPRRLRPKEQNPRAHPNAAGDGAAGDAESFHHNVYVVLLDAKVAEHPTVQRLNPRRDPTKPCVYVGMTGLDPVERFANHKRGHKSAWTVHRYGLRLLPEMYECYNPMPFHIAAEMEQGLAEDLRADGYTVTGGK